MTHTIETANGFKIEQRGVGHTWMYFMATREDVAEIKTHHDLGTVKAWCEAQPIRYAPVSRPSPPTNPAAGRPSHLNTLQEIADKGFAGWLGLDELTEKE
jgi:hypothetical protein